MKRATWFFLIFVLVGWLFVPAAHAQGINPILSAEEFGAIVDAKSNAGQMSKEVYSINTQAYYLDSGTCLITGCSSASTSAFYYGKSAIANVNNVIFAMYNNPPADLALWLHTTAQDLGFEPRQAYAQGIGFTGLSPLLPVWKAFRNIAYLLLAVVMIAIGFMIMLRKKIDPKTVVTVQNALPRIVLVLLLITFSYAIVGVMIDIMYLCISFISVIMTSGFSGVPGYLDNLLNGGFWALLVAVFRPVAMMNPLSKVLPNLLSGNFIDALNHLGEGLVFNLTAVGPLVQFIVGIAYLFAYFRILLMLLNSYIQVIISTIVGPIQLLVDVFPGSNSFSSWLKNLAANLVVFPITIFMLLLGNVLFDNASAGTLWVPPLLPQGVGAGDFALSIICLGVILTIPNIVNSLKEALKAKGAPAGPGAMFGPAVQGGTGLLNVAYQGSMAYSMIRGRGGKQEGVDSSPLASMAKDIRELKEHMMKS